MKRTLPILLAAAFLVGIFSLLLFLRTSLEEEGLTPTPFTPATLDTHVPVREAALPFAVPVLMYHHVADFPESAGVGDEILYVSPKTFNNQMGFLSSNGFRTTRLDRLTDTLAMKVGDKPVVLTFDDGYEDAFTTVLPILKRYGFQATFYVVVDDIGKPGYLTQDEILEMQSEGMRFGSHTLTHPDLTALSISQAENEIYGSKFALERLLGETVSDFCYPGGLLNGSIRDIVANSGYETATTTVNDTNRGTVDPLRLNRLNIRETTDFRTVPQLND